MTLQILRPTLDLLPSYIAALEQSWGPDNSRPVESGKEELQKIAEDPALFVERMYDPEAKGDPITLPDGSKSPRLPGYRLWMWDGEFCGSIGFRWQSGANTLPPYVHGHIGYSVVPWKQRRGYATKALALLLPMAKEQGLSYVELTAVPGNLPSQKVITGNGGYLVEKFITVPAYGGKESQRFRINL